MKESNELFELCKQVYETTGWDDTRDFYHEQDNYDEVAETFRRNGKWVVVERKRAEYDVPFYTSDYLLGRLPSKIPVEETPYTASLVVEFCLSSETDWRACYYHDGDIWLYNEIADTPLKALLKLTLKLHEEKMI